jgi:hypothetical protein
MTERPQKITFAEMCEMDVRGILNLLHRLSMLALDRRQRQPPAG